MRRFRILLLACLWPAAALAGGPFTILDGINQAVTTNPGVGEAAANRRATETELRQTQSTLLPQVRVEAKWGQERFNFQDNWQTGLGAVPPLGNQTWLNGREASVFVRQLLFDGFTSINEIWRQAARVDAAAARVHERTELLALDAAEGYIDVVRYTHLVGIARENVAAHQRIFSNVQARYQGGRAGEGDLQQVQERVEAANAALAQFEQSLDEARAKFRKTIGIEPVNLRVPSRLAAMPQSKDEALAVTLQHNPTIKAAEADKEAARYAFDATTGAFMPTVTLEGRAVRGENTDTVFGRRSDVSGFVVASWDIFRGGQDSWRRAEMAERYQQQTMAHARLQRDAYESIDKAWAARTITSDRIAALNRQIIADRKVIVAYQNEYELGQRSLIDLLNAQNQLFNALVSIESTRGVAVFADYQLLAAMGQLLEYLKMPHPIDAEPLEFKPLGLTPTKLAPILIKLPEPGSEPLNIGASGRAAYAKADVATAEGSFRERWPHWQLGPTTAWLDVFFGKQSGPTTAPTAEPGASSQASSYAPETPRDLSSWLVWVNKVN